MFGASSQNRRLSNSDGSYNVYCSQCSSFICTTMMQIHRALCYPCQKAEAGEQMSPEALQLYQTSRMVRDDVSFITLPEPDFKALGVNKKASRFMSVAGEVFRAIGRFALNESSKPPDKVQPSTVLAKSKRQPRLFSNIKLGSMEEIDKKIKPGE